MWGWLIQYDLGDQYWMLPADVEVYLCPMRAGLVVVAGAQDGSDPTALEHTPATDVDTGHGAQDGSDPTALERTPTTDVDTGHDMAGLDSTDTDSSGEHYDPFESSGEDMMSQLRTDVESDTYCGSGVVPDFVIDVEE